MRHLAALLVLLLAGCSGNLPPIPPGPPKQCPASCPTGTACTDPAKGCQPIPAPGEVCAEGKACSCWHWPPSALSWLYACCAPGVPGGVVSVQDPAQCPVTPPPAQVCPEACPAGQECIDPSKGCVPKPSCPKPCPVVGWVCTDPAVGCVPVTPPPPEGCVLSGEPTETVPGHAPQLGQQVNAAILRVHPECGVAGGRCVVPERPQAFQAAVEAELRSAGLCAGQHTPTTDEIAVETPGSGVWEGWHIYAGQGWDDPAADGTVVWAPQAARAAWKAPGTTPPPSGACPAPQPDRSPEHLTIALHCGSRWCDATPQTVATLGYCTQIGMSPMADGTLRASCPMRSECPGYQCESRAACEAYAMGGDYRWESRPESGVIERNPDNPAQAQCGAGCTGIRVCTQDRSVCSEWH